MALAGHGVALIAEAARTRTMQRLLAVVGHRAAHGQPATVGRVDGPLGAGAAAAAGDDRRRRYAHDVAVELVALS